MLKQTGIIKNIKKGGVKLVVNFLQDYGVVMLK